MFSHARLLLMYFTKCFPPGSRTLQYQWNRYSTNSALISPKTCTEYALKSQLRLKISPAQLLNYGTSFIYGVKVGQKS